MKNYACFNYNLLFGDHFNKVSNQAKLYYIKLMFYADRGFVANPITILDSLGYDKSVYWELVKNDEILTLPDRCEIFITSYYLHNRGFNWREWTKSPFCIYWFGKLAFKQNGVAKFNPNGLKQKTGDNELLANVKMAKGTENEEISDEEWNKLIGELTSNEKDF